MPPPGVPGPFSLDDSDRLEKGLSEGGLTDIEVGELPTPYGADSFDEWWSRTVALAGPVAQLLKACRSGGGEVPELGAESARVMVGTAVCSAWSA